MNEPVELPVEDLEPLAVRPPGSDQQNEDVVYCVSSDSELQSDHFYEYAQYEYFNVNEDDDGVYRPDFHNLEGMIMMKQIMLTIVSHMIMLKLLMLIMVSHMRQMLSRLGLGGLAKHQLLMTKLRRVVRLRGVT